MLNNNFKLRNRLEINKIDKKEEYKENGYLLYQDVIYKLNKYPIALYFRYAMFDTDSYRSRIYSYENDLLYSFSLPAMYYKGTRTYLMLKYSVKKRIDLWLKYAITNYNNKDIIGSGLDEIKDNKKQEVKVQLRMRF